MLDLLGKQIKTWEKEYESRVIIPIEPLIVRLDGRAFSKYTKKFEKPFSSVFSDLMISTTKFLCQAYKPDIAYVQSDEINLCFLPKFTVGFQHIFGGRPVKISSVLAGQASSHFTRCIVEMGIDGTPHFDGRTFTCIESNLGSWRHETALYFLWRHKDATRNGILQYAQSLFSQKQLQGVKTEDVLHMIGQDKYEKVQHHFRLGTFLFKSDIYQNTYLSKSYHEILNYIKGEECTIS
jgi:tRNA(His) guanylyltransferase